MSLPYFDLTPTSAPPLRWFIFHANESVFGSFSRTEEEAKDDVTQRIAKRRKRGDATAAPTLTRDTAAEERANAFLGHVQPALHLAPSGDRRNAPKLC